MTSATKRTQKVSAFSAYKRRKKMLCSISLILIAGMFMGLTVLVGAVLAIVLTAPLGAFAIDLMYGRLLKKRWMTNPDLK